jgi:hypothetical protein
VYLKEVECLMGRKRKLRSPPLGREKYDRIKESKKKQFKRVTEIFGARDARKLRDAGINFGTDLQNTCKKDPEKLLKIWGFGPKTVRRLCNKIGVDKSINGLERIYDKIEKKKQKASLGVLGFKPHSPHQFYQYYRLKV